MFFIISLVCREIESYGPVWREIKLVEKHWLSLTLIHNLIISVNIASLIHAEQNSTLKINLLIKKFKYRKPEAESQGTRNQRFRPISVLWLIHHFLIGAITVKKSYEEKVLLLYLLLGNYLSDFNIFNIISHVSIVLFTKKIIFGNFI